MSGFAYGFNNSFDNYQNMRYEPLDERSRYGINTVGIPKRYKSPIIYDAGVDNYVFNEIKKAKYQGVFDPGSLGNKNIFMDSNKTNNKNSGYNEKKLRKNKAHYNKIGEGKNLLILKSETKYPLNYVSHTLRTDMNNYPKQGKNIYNFNNYYIETRNNNYRNIYSRSNDNKRNFLSPDNNGKRETYLLQNDNYLAKTINIEKLNKDYNKRFNEPKRTLYGKYSNNTISFNNLAKNFSPTFAPSRNPNLIKQNTMNYINVSYSKNLNNLTRDENENINNTYNFYNDIALDDYILNDNSIDKKDTKKDIKLITFYRKKLLNLFFWHMKNFFNLHFKSLFNQIIDLLKTSINNNEHNFEDKTIKNIASLKKELKSNSFYYGRNGKYNDLLKEVKKKEKNNLQLENVNNTNEIDIENIKYLNTDVNKLESKEMKIYNKSHLNKRIASYKKVINKKKFIGNNNNLNDHNNKYVKKKIPQGIYGKKIVQQKINKLKLFDLNEKNDDKNNNIQRKKNISKIEKTPIIRRRLKSPNSGIKDNKMLNSGIKIIDNSFLNRNNNNDDSIKLDEAVFENNMDKKSSEFDKNTPDNFAIDKNAIYTIKSQYEVKNENIESNSKANEFENYSNKNLENAISIITKVIENKERDDKENKIAYLVKIINNTINKDKSQNMELIKKYFNILKDSTNDFSNEEKKTSKKLDLSKDLIKKTQLKRNKKLKKNLFLSDIEDNKEKEDLSFEKNMYKSEDEDKNRNKRKKDKFRLIIKQIRLQRNIMNKNQFNFYRPKTPTKYNINSIIDNNNKTPKIIIKKTINIIFNKPNKNSNQQVEINKKELNEIEGGLLVKEGSEEKKISDHEEKEEENIELNNYISDINVINKEDKGKKLDEKFNEELSIRNMFKFRRSIFKFNKNKIKEGNNDQYNTETEIYEDYENFVFFLRTQLIYCFLSNKNNDNSFLD